MLRRGNYRHKFGQRFAIFSERTVRRLEPGGWTWIHAVSVGEMLMGLKLARTLQAAQPGLRVLISTTTSTGFAVARQQLRGDATGTELIYYPLDLTPVVRRVLDLVRPRQIILVDKELWPNLISECYRRAIPVSIVNARLSPRSERRFLKWRRWVGPFFAMLEQVCVQEPEDAPRWNALGVRQSALHHTGSLKFDYAEPGPSRAGEFRALLERLGLSATTPVLLGGSTFPGEEAILGRLFLKLRERLPGLFLILVPRHVERTPEVEAVMGGLGLRFILRTALGGTETPNPSEPSEPSELPALAEPPHVPGLDSSLPADAAKARPDVLIVNTTGELRDWYAVATVCFIGKSMSVTAIGGQNPAEPVLAGRPAVFGAHMENFSSLVRQFLAAGGAIQVRDEEELLQAVEPLLADPALGATLAGKARGVLRAHQGANQRAAELLLAPRPPAEQPLHPAAS